VEKSQYELCIEVLRRLSKAGILKDLVMVGSWCMAFYRDYFEGIAYSPSITTRDLDLLIPAPSAIRQKTDVAGLLKDLGFVVGFTGAQGYIRLEHPQLIIEFLVPERGRASDKPFPLPQLGLNAQQLRFLELLSENTITVEVEDVTVTLPHPANFALHKLLIVTRRPIEAKKDKDRQAAAKILKALVDKGEKDIVLKLFRALPRKWQTKIKNAVADMPEVTTLVIFD
jgi:hypothetical protein